MLALLKSFSWQELRHHRWRNAAAVVAVMLGVALAFSVQLINASALDTFSAAVRSVDGRPDLTLRAARGTFDDRLFARVAQAPQVALASPVLELPTYAVTATGRVPLRVIGVDALVVAQLAPALLPRPRDGADRMAMLTPGHVFLNASARTALQRADGTMPATLELQSGLALRQVRVAGSVAASGAPLAVMDIAAAQVLFGQLGRLSRIDLRLVPGTDRAAFVRSLALPGDVTASDPGDTLESVGNVSRAYRVNLTVLALVALFTGAFLVYSVLALGVAKRGPQFALLAVLGLTARERLTLVLLESGVLGVVGSVAGLILGAGLAALGLKLLGGDLGGGYFEGESPALQWSWATALIYGALGVLTALAGAAWPARAAQRIRPAVALKGLAVTTHGTRAPQVGAVLVAAGALLTLAPPVAGMPLAAYLAVALLLVGGIVALPGPIALVLDRLAPRLGRRLLPLLAIERARRVRHDAAVAVSGVVAALSLAVALTVMVTSFRGSVLHWLDQVLPADLYLRTATTAGTGDTAYLPPPLVQAIARLPGVQRVSAQRSTRLLLARGEPPVTLIARELGADALPLLAPALPVPPGRIAIYVSEAVVDLYGARPGTAFPGFSKLFSAGVQEGSTKSAIFFVAGVWRDYARQFGAVAIARRDYERLTGDRRVNDLALWLRPGADPALVQQQIRALARAQTQTQAGTLLEFASAAQIRANSLRIFDRSFAVTYWLQAVAIVIGLFGVAASFGAQVLARRREFGLLAHLGLTRRQILAVVAGEGVAWTAIGAAAGLILGLGVSLILVRVVNPQSFHWTMDLLLPWGRLLLLCAAVVLAGTATAWIAGRAAAGRDAVLAVKEDW